MANPNPKPPPIHSRFKKGQVANPTGANGVNNNPELRTLRTLTESEMVEIGSLVVKGSIAQLKAIKDDPSTSVLKAMMASVAIKTIAKGDAAALEILLTRLIGKVKDKVEVISTNHTTLAGEVGVYDASKINAALNKLQSDV